MTIINKSIAINAEFDSESHSWWAWADIDDHHSLVTGAATFDKLLQRIPIVLHELMAHGDDQDRTAGASHSALAR